MKLKTHKATAKRVKATASGKLVRVKAAVSHLLSHKSDRTKVTLPVHAADQAKIKRMLPYI